jgi:phospholipid transport system substrate-binding protein
MLFVSIASANPVSILQTSIDSLFNYLKQNPQQDPEKVRQFVGKYLVPHFDFKRMAQLSAGRYFRGMSTEQKQQFTVLFKNKFLKAMMSRLNIAPTGKILYLPMRRYRNELRLTLKIPQPRGVPAKVTFKLHNVGGAWKIFDVAAGSQSAIIFYRRYFSLLFSLQGLQSVLQSPK